jgi:hypothetical protein
MFSTVVLTQNEARVADNHAEVHLGTHRQRRIVVHTTRSARRDTRFDTQRVPEHRFHETFTFAQIAYARPNAYVAKISNDSMASV